MDGKIDQFALGLGIKVSDAMHQFKNVHRIQVGIYIAMHNF